MAYIYTDEVWADGDYATPRELNQVLKRSFNELNGGIDRDNFDSAGIGADKFEDRTFNLLHFKRSSAVGTGVVVSVQNAGTAWLDIETLAETIETPDCTLILKLNLDYLYTRDGVASTFPAKFYVPIGIMVDDELVASTDGEYHDPARINNSGVYGSQTREMYNHAALEVRVPVAAGSHRVRGVWRFWTKVRPNIVLSGSATIFPTHRILTTREMRR